MADEAKDLAKRLEGGRLDRQIVERQERLFRRMLDAGRTLQGKEEDERKERQSTTATADSVHLPPALRAKLARRRRPPARADVGGAAAALARGAAARGRLLPPAVRAREPVMRAVAGLLLALIMALLARPRAGTGSGDGARVRARAAGQLHRGGRCLSRGARRASRRMPRPCWDSSARWCPPAGAPTSCRRSARRSPPRRTNAAVFGVALRAYAAADAPDSLRVVAERWAAAAPGDETPFREWGAAALGRRDRPGAAAAYLQRHASSCTGRMRSRPSWPSSPIARRRLPHGASGNGCRRSGASRDIARPAVNNLAPAPDSLRDDLLRQLEHEDDFPARRLQADLRARWGDPLGGLDALQAALPADRATAVDALRGLLDQLRTQVGHDAKLTQGRALELIAERSTEAERARLRLDAARAYTAAGDRDAARRMLVGIADDQSAPGAVVGRGVVDPGAGVDR